MGKIKKILETELVGGTQSTDVYPVTSTKAVYDENNVRLDTILKPATKEAAGLMSPEDKKNIDDKLSKSEGGEVNKPIVVTNKDSNYSTTINPDGSIYIWDKNLRKNILNVQIDKSRNTIDINSPDGNPINISNILNLIGKVGSYNSNIYSAYDDKFSASKFELRTGTNNQVLLGDGSTILLNERNGIPTLNENGKIDENQIDDLSGYVSTLSGHINATYNEYNNITYLNISGDSGIKGSAGEITIERTDEVDGDLSSDTIIRLDGITGSIEATSATFTDKVKANGFLANYNGNDYTAWTTNGGSIDLINLLSNAAIYVAGKFELAESGIDITTVVDSPNSIIFDLGTQRFLARKDLICYTHWKADISKNIAPPSRYGIETDDGVFPFNNQMYKFSTYDNIFIAICSNGTCSMKILTLE